MAEGIEEVPARVGNTLTRKLGPFPVWVWGVGIVGIAGVVYLVFLRGGGSSSASPSGILGGGTPPTGGLGGDSGGGGGGGGGSTTPPAPPTATLTNFQWLNKVVPTVAQTLGLPVAQVQLYLSEYLNGQAPLGSTTASSIYQKVIAAATQAGGEPPGPPTSPSSTSYFGSNQSWLASILEFLPSGTPGSVQTELTNLVNGTTAYISQAAADALNSAIGIVGSAPTSLSYQVGSPPTAPPPPPPPPPPPSWTVPTVDQSLVDQIVAAYQGALQKTPSGVSTATQTTFWADILGVPANVATYVLNQSNAYTKATGINSSPTMIQNWLQQAYKQGIT